MYKKLVPLFLIAAIFALFSIPLKADTITQGGISYTFTAGEADGGGVFDVNLAINTSGASISGTLSSFAVQFTGATNVTLETGPTGWAVQGQGPSTANGCNINGSANHWCLSGPTINVPGGTSNFVLDVTMPAGTALPTQSDIQAFQSQGVLAISSGIGIGTAVPEPSSVTMLGSGLFGLMGLFFVRRKVQS
jgi:hypothetical protein